MKIIGYMVVGLLGFMLLGAIGMGLRIFFFPATVATNMIDTVYDANNKIINADNAIYNYEWFKQQKEDIDASKRQLDNARASYDAFKSNLPEYALQSFEDKSESARLNAVVLGLENNLENQIGDYNARAGMATRNIFEDHVLPDYIDALTFIRQ
jgi:hypothetical protein